MDILGSNYLLALDALGATWMLVNVIIDFVLALQRFLQPPVQG
jgi:hypothetical protein